MPDRFGVRDEGPAKWFTAGPGLQMRPMVEGSGAAIILYRIAPGIEFDLHRHEYSELAVVLAGGGELRIDTEFRELRAGDSYFVPGNTPHSFSVPPDGTATVLMDVSVGLPADTPGPSTAQLLRQVEPLVHRTSTARPTFR